MSSVFGAIVSFLESLVDAVVEFFEAVWDGIVMPILEEIFSWFGIEDETMVDAYKVSTKIFGSNTEDVVKAAKIRGVLKWIKQDTSLWRNIMYELILTRAQMRSYYKYAEQGHYVHGLPDMTVKGGNLDNAAIVLALDIEKSSLNTVLEADSTYPLPDIYFKHEIQSAPTNYNPGLDTLTYDNEWGLSFSDWYWLDVEFIVGPNTYDITIERVAEEAIFYIEGPENVTEGDSITYILRCNRIIPVGESVTVNLVYAGTLAGTEYTPVPSVVMLAGTDSFDIVIPILEDAIVESVATLQIVVDSVINTNGAFEAVVVGVSNIVTTNVYDNDALLLTLNDVFINEADVSVTIPVTLPQAVAAAFTVDYDFTDGTALGGIDYDNTVGTLNFAGTVGEVQNIVIPLTADVVSGSRETFTVGLNNSSDLTLDITREAVITIVDTDIGGPVPGTTLYQQVINKPNYVRERSLIVTYHLTTDPDTNFYYWIYPYALATYEDLEPTMSIIQNMEMLPIAILRKNKVSINNDKTTPEYKTTKNLLRRLSMDLDDVITSVEQSEDGGGNSNINDIDDVYINFAVNPTDLHPVLSKILWLSFYEIIVTYGITSNTEQYSAAISEQDVNNACVWSAHGHIANIVGVKTEVGEYVHEVSGTNLRIFCQITETEYEELFINNMNGLSSINYGGYHQVAVNKLGDPEFTIPISLFVFDQLKHTEIMQAYQYIFRLDMFALVITELAWYETSAFFDLFEFVMIVVTIFTLGAAGGILALVQTLATNYLIAELVIFIAEATGNAELAALIGVIAAVALSNTSTFPNIDIGTAEGLTAAVSSFSDNLGVAFGVDAKEMQSDLKELTDKFEDQVRQQEAASVGFTEPLINGKFYASIQSVDTSIYTAGNLQYNFDAKLTDGYDRLISRYHDNLLQIGIV